MHCISANPPHEAESAATFSAHRTSKTHLTTERCSTSQRYSRLSCPVQAKPNWALVTSAPVKQSPCNSFSKRWATNNHPHQSKPTTAQCMESSPTTSNHAVPKQWTCTFTGYIVVTRRANFTIIDAQGPTPEPTTGPSTIVPHITSKNALQF